MAGCSKRRFSVKEVVEALEIDSDSEPLVEPADSEDDVNLSSDITGESSEYETESEGDASDEARDARAWFRVDPARQCPPPPRFPFTGKPGLNVEVPSDPLSYFRLFVSDSVIDKIVVETNRYAEQTDTSHTKPFSRANKWDPVTSDDIFVFLGLIILQGILGKPVQRWYWSKNKLLETPIFSRYMSECRFSLIMKNLHFTNNDEFDEATHPAPKLKKIWEIFQEFISNCQQTYTPERDVSVDESLMAYKGRLSWIQYIASKRARFGIKFYMLCESNTGYIWNSVLYTGKGTTWDGKYSQYGIATSSVLTLMDPLLDNGYCLTTDNFYTSPELVDILVQRKTDVYGTVRPNRRDMPKSMPKTKLQRGDVAAWQRGKVIALKWKDKKDVHLLSTVHDASTTIVRVRGDKEVSKPVAVVAYNHTMGGVDRADQALTFYPVMRKQQKKYYKKIFRHLIEQCLWNAYVLFKKYVNKKLSHADFTWKLVEQILAEHKPSVLPARSGRRCSTVVNPERLIGRHFIDYCPPTAKKQNASRMCVVCCSKVGESGKKVRKETRYCCPDCDVGLCLVPCFKLYHTEDVY